MKKRSKRYQEIKVKIKKQYYSSEEAFVFLQENKQEKFTNIEVVFSLKWNPKQQPLKATLTLPYKHEKQKKEIKTDKGGSIHFILGNIDFPLHQLQENYQFLYNKIKSLRPHSWKDSIFVNSVFFSSTMSPRLKIST